MSGQRYKKSTNQRSINDARLARRADAADLSDEQYDNIVAAKNKARADNDADADADEVAEDSAREADYKKASEETDRLLRTYNMKVRAKKQK